MKQWKLLYYLSNFFIILQTSNDKCNHQVESFMALSKWAPPTPGCLLFIKSFQSNYQHHTTHPLWEIKSTLKKHSIRKKKDYSHASCIESRCTCSYLAICRWFRILKRGKSWGLLVTFKEESWLLILHREMFALEVLFLVRQYSQFSECARFTT